MLTVSEVNGVSGDVGSTVTLPSGALLTLNANGSYDYDPNNVFDGLSVGQTATDSFDYTIDDGNGGTDSATVNITILGGNEAPTATNSDYTTDEATTVNGNALTEDTGSGIDSDPDAADVLTVTEVNGDATAIGSQITLPSGALLTMNADGTYSYDPNGQFEGLAVGESTTDSFTYTIDDGNLCLLYTSPSPRDATLSRMPSSA